MKLLTSFTAALCLIGAGPVFSKNIVETAQAAGDFSILLKAAKAAGMDGMLTQPGPYTIFAPTDAAFNALPPGMLDMLLKPENKDMLKMVLGYHTVFGRLTTHALKEQKSAAMATIGQPVVLEKKGADIMVNEAKIMRTDVMADNGVIQVVDKVLLPAKPVQPETD